MIRPDDIVLSVELRNKFTSFSANKLELIGIRNAENFNCLIEQLIDSIRRIKYVTVLRDLAGITANSANVDSIAFDPLKASLWHSRNGNSDEAFWMIFLLTHFGKNKRSKWSLLKAAYGGLNSDLQWNWDRVSESPREFGIWIERNQEALRQQGSFGNHRKYESLNYDGTGRAIESYVAWVNVHGHLYKINEVLQGVGDNRFLKFDSLYNSLNEVHRFGRTSKFDYLTMLGKTNLIDAEPGSTYMVGATGPLFGGRLLFTGTSEANLTRNEVQDLLSELNDDLELYFGMQVLEDALCNWQKSPSLYKYFGG